MDGDKLDVGLLVDSVKEVIDLEPSHLEEAPSFGNRIRLDFIQAIGKLEEQFVILLQVNQLLNTSELSQISETVSSQ